MVPEPGFRNKAFRTPPAPRTSSRYEPRLFRRKRMMMMEDDDAANMENEMENPLNRDDDDEDEEEEVEKAEKAPAPKEEVPVKKPVSAFLHYCAEQRPFVKTQLPNASAGDITKAISESWRGLGDEERQKFVDLAAADKSRYEKVKKPATEKKVPEPYETVIPVARVKKIAKLDPDLKSLSKEATAVLAKMAELFVGKLATETHVASNGKKIIKASDVAHCIHARPLFAWLRVDYPLNEYPKEKPVKKTIPRPANNASIDAFVKRPRTLDIDDMPAFDDDDDPAASSTLRLISPPPDDLNVVDLGFEQPQTFDDAAGLLDDDDDDDDIGPPDA